MPPLESSACWSTDQVRPPRRSVLEERKGSAEKEEPVTWKTVQGFVISGQLREGCVQESKGNHVKRCWEVQWEEDQEFAIVLQRAWTSRH